MIRGFLRWLSTWPAYRWVILMAAVYFVVALTGTWINYVDLHISPGGTGGYDLSINQQALSSTIHSNRPYPFYEATNCGRSDRCSFLLIHPVFFAYLVAIPYAWAPSAFTLFAIQDVALALAALPLFAITRQVAKSTRLALVVSGVYLVWWPSFSGIFSFHWEAFLPLELFLVFWLWLSHRYWLAFPVVILSYVTLEIMPLLMFLIAIFFLLGWWRFVLEYARMRFTYLATRMGPEASASVAMSLARLGRALFKPPQVRASLLLLVGSVAAYVALHEFITSGGGLLGLPPLPPAYAIPLSQPVHSATFTVANLLSGWQNKVLFWLVMFGSLAMIPLLAPRALILSAPWVVYSGLTTSSYVQTGNQYAFISAAVMFIGFAYGVAQLKQWADKPRESRSSMLQRKTAPTGDSTVGSNEPPSSASTSPTPGLTVPAVPEKSEVGGPVIDANEANSPPARSTPDPGSPAAGRLKRPHRHLAYPVIAVIVVGILAFNIALNPLIPGSSTLRGDLGTPFEKQPNLGLSGFNATGYNLIEKLVAIIGSRSVVAAAPAMFPFVANDPYAYPLYSKMNDYLLPFNTTIRTQYVILVSKPDIAYSGSIPSFLNESLYNSSRFGVRAWIPTTYFGDVWLLERGYNGLTQVLGSASLSSGGTYTARHGLEPGVAGRVIKNATSLAGTVIASKSISKQSGDVPGTVFDGPNASLAAGTYRVSMNVSGRQIESNMNASGTTPVVSVNFTGETAGLYQVYITNASLNLSWFATGAWTSFDFDLTLSCPLLDAVIMGETQVNWFDFQVNYISITPETSS